MKSWVGPGGQGVWSVPDSKWDELWESADWDTRFINDPKRAQREWDKLNREK